EPAIGSFHLEGYLWKRAAGACSELREEAGVVLEEVLDVRDAVPEERDALEPHAEREPGPLLGVDAAVLEDDGVDHPAAEDLDEAGVLAEGAAGARAVRPLAEHAADVDLRARLDEREV